MAHKLGNRAIRGQVIVADGIQISESAKLPEGDAAVVFVTHVGTEWEHHSVVFWTYKYKASWWPCSSSNTTVTVKELTVTPSPFTFADTVEVKGGFFTKHTITGGYIDTSAKALGKSFEFPQQALCGSSSRLKCPLTGDFYLTATFDLAKLKLKTTTPYPPSTATSTGYSDSGVELFCYNLEIKLVF